MLKIIISILDKHKIKYFATGGTLLGCLRHRGFIPNDNDVDIGINIINVSKLLSINSELNKNGLKLIGTNGIIVFDFDEKDFKINVNNLYNTNYHDKLNNGCNGKGHCSASTSENRGKTFGFFFKIVDISYKINKVGGKNQIGGGTDIDLFVFKQYKNTNK